jgi:hypothetical protein
MLCVVVECRWQVCEVNGYLFWVARVWKWRPVLTYWSNHPTLSTPVCTVCAVCVRARLTCEARISNSFVVCIIDGIHWTKRVREERRCHPTRGARHTRTPTRSERWTHRPYRRERSTWHTAFCGRICTDWISTAYTLRAQLVFHSQVSATGI